MAIKLKPSTSTESQFYPLKDSVFSKIKPGSKVKTEASKIVNNKSSGFFKNILKSTATLGFDVVDTYAPSTKDLASSFKETVILAKKEIASTIRNKQEISRNKSQDLNKTIDELENYVVDEVGSISKRLKSGKFYMSTEQRMTESLEKQYGDLTNFGDEDFGDFDDLSSQAFASSSDTYVTQSSPDTLSDEPFGGVTKGKTRQVNISARQRRSKAASSSGRRSGHSAQKTHVQPIMINTGGGELRQGDELVSKTTSRVGSAIINHDEEIWAKNYKVSETQFSRLYGYQNEILKGVNAIVNYTNNVASTNVRAQMEFQGKMLAAQQDLLDNMKELKDTLIVVGTYDPEKEAKLQELKKKKNNKSEDLLNGNMIDPAKYIKTIKENIKKELARTNIGAAALTTGMIGGTKGLGLKFTDVFSPWDMIVKSAFGTILSQNTRSRMKEFNTSINSFWPSLLGKFNEMAKYGNSNVTRTIGRILGTENNEINLKKNTGENVKDLKSVVGWTRKNDIALTEVIPKLLAKQLAAMTGDEELSFNYERGDFRSVSQAKAIFKRKEAESLRNRETVAYTGKITSLTENILAKTGATNSTEDRIQEDLKRAKINPKDINRYMSNIMTNLIKDGIPFNLDLFHDNSSYRSRILQGIPSNYANAVGESFAYQYSQMTIAERNELTGAIYKANRQGQAKFDEFIKNMKETSDFRINYNDYNKEREARDIINALNTDKKYFINRNGKITNKANLLAQKARMTQFNRLTELGFSFSEDETGQIVSSNLKSSSSKENSNLSFSTEGNVQSIYKLLVNGIMVYPSEQVPDELVKLRQKVLGSKAGKFNSEEFERDYNNLLDKEEGEYFENERIAELSRSYLGKNNFWKLFAKQRKRNRGGLINTFFNRVLDSANNLTNEIFNNGQKAGSGIYSNRYNEAYRYEQENVRENINSIQNSLNKFAANHDGKFLGGLAGLGARIFTPFANKANKRLDSAQASLEESIDKGYIEERARMYEEKAKHALPWNKKKYLEKARQLRSGNYSSLIDRTISKAAGGIRRALGGSNPAGIDRIIQDVSAESEIENEEGLEAASSAPEVKTPNLSIDRLSVSKNVRSIYELLANGIMVYNGYGKDYKDGVKYINKVRSDIGLVNAELDELKAQEERIAAEAEARVQAEEQAIENRNSDITTEEAILGTRTSLNSKYGKQISISEHAKSRARVGKLAKSLSTGAGVYLGVLLGNPILGAIVGNKIGKFINSKVQLRYQNLRESLLAMGFLDAPSANDKDLYTLALSVSGDRGDELRLSNDFIALSKKINKRTLSKKIKTAALKVRDTVVSGAKGISHFMEMKKKGTLRYRHLMHIMYDYVNMDAYSEDTKDNIFDEWDPFILHSRILAMPDTDELKQNLMSTEEFNRLDDEVRHGRKGFLKYHLSILTNKAKAIRKNIATTVIKGAHDGLMMKNKTYRYKNLMLIMDRIVNKDYYAGNLNIAYYNIYKEWTPEVLFSFIMTMPKDSSEESILRAKIMSMPEWKTLVDEIKTGRKSLEYLAAKKVVNTVKKFKGTVFRNTLHRKYRSIIMLLKAQGSEYEFIDSTRDPMDILVMFTAWGENADHPERKEIYENMKNSKAYAELLAAASYKKRKAAGENVSKREIRKTYLNARKTRIKYGALLAVINNAGIVYDKDGQPIHLTESSSRQEIYESAMACILYWKARKDYASIDAVESMTVFKELLRTVGKKGKNYRILDSAQRLEARKSRMRGYSGLSQFEEFNSQNISEEDAKRIQEEFDTRDNKLLARQVGKYNTNIGGTAEEFDRLKGRILGNTLNEDELRKIASNPKHPLNKEAKEYFAEKRNQRRAARVNMRSYNDSEAVYNMRDSMNGNLASEYAQGIARPGQESTYESYVEDGQTHVRRKRNTNSHGRYEFTEAEIAEMFDLYDVKNMSLKSLAEKYGVSVSVISNRLKSHNKARYDEVTERKRNDRESNGRANSAIRNAFGPLNRISLDDLKKKIRARKRQLRAMGKDFEDDEILQKLIAKHNEIISSLATTETSSFSNTVDEEVQSSSTESPSIDAEVENSQSTAESIGTRSRVNAERRRVARENRARLKAQRAEEKARAKAQREIDKIHRVTDSVKAPSEMSEGELKKKIKELKKIYKKKGFQTVLPLMQIYEMELNRRTNSQEGPQHFAIGGIVKGPRSGDQVDVKANGGEMVLTERHQKNLLNILKSPFSKFISLSQKEIRHPKKSIFASKNADYNFMGKVFSSVSRKTKDVKTGLLASINAGLSSMGESFIKLRHFLGENAKGEGDEKNTETVFGKLSTLDASIKKIKINGGSGGGGLLDGLLSKLGGKLGLLGTLAGLLFTGVSIGGKVNSVVNRGKEEGVGSGISYGLGISRESDTQFNPDGTKKNTIQRVTGNLGDNWFNNSKNGLKMAKQAIAYGKGRLVRKATLKTLTKEVNKDLIKNVAKGNPIKGVKQFFKDKAAAKALAKEAGKAAREGVEKNGLGFTKALKSLFDKVMNNGIVKKFFGTNLGKTLSGVGTKILGGAEKVVSKVAKVAGKAIPFLSIVTSAVDVVTSIINGAVAAGRYFQVPASQVTAGMRWTACLYKGLWAILDAVISIFVPGVGAVITSLVRACIPEAETIRTIYCAIAGPAAEEELKQKQQMLKDDAARLGVDSEKLANYENKTVGDHFGDFLSNLKGVVFEGKKWGDGQKERDAKNLGVTVEQFEKIEKDVKETEDKRKREGKKAYKDGKEVVKVIATLVTDMFKHSKIVGNSNLFGIYSSKSWFSGHNISYKIADKTKKFILDAFGKTSFINNFDSLDDKNKSLDVLNKVDKKTLDSYINTKMNSDSNEKLPPGSFSTQAVIVKKCTNICLGLIKYLFSESNIEKFVSFSGLISESEVFSFMDTIITKEVKSMEKEKSKLEKQYYAEMSRTLGKERAKAQYNKDKNAELENSNSGFDSQGNYSSANDQRTSEQIAAEAAETEQKNAASAAKNQSLQSAKATGEGWVKSLPTPVMDGLKKQYPMLMSITNYKDAVEKFRKNRTATTKEIDNLMSSGNLNLLQYIASNIAKGSPAAGQDTNTNNLDTEMKNKVEAAMNYKVNKNGDPDPNGKTLKEWGVTIRESIRYPLTQMAYYSKGRAKDPRVVDTLMKMAGFKAGGKFWGGDGTEPGHITETIASNHMQGNAVDLNTGKNLTYKQISKTMKKAGMEWGGDWEGGWDQPHFENIAGKKQAFARGGIVKGPETGDRVNIRANGGELVLTKEQQTALYAMTKDMADKYIIGTKEPVAKLNESPLVTNDKKTIEMINQALDIQAAIHAEQLRHNQATEGLLQSIIKLISVLSASSGGGAGGLAEQIDRISSTLTSGAMSNASGL